MEFGRRLELNWVGKGHSPKIEPRIRVEDDQLSHIARANFPNAMYDNMLIQGDNLLALKSLENDFAGSVKCVFIDPPYNTGSAFSHYDDGVEHSVWLGMMNERLRILYKLLKDDGSLWVTIDDNESHYLKIMLDEIFGRKNFIANVVWQKKYTVANDAKYFSDNHDHILVYAKDRELWRPNRLARSEEMNARYSNPDLHPKGPWKATPLHAKSGSTKSASFSYTFRNGVTWRPPAGTYPRFSEETLRKLDEGNEIWFGRDGKASPSRKTFLSELTNTGTPPLTVWLSSETGHNHEAKNEVKEFNQQDVFATPKPERLLQRILQIATDQGDIVLDSFAGSGTTGAVAHKMGRRWIMVELGDHAVTHIVPRLKKVIDGDDSGGVTELTGWQGGGGFRYYRLAPSLLEKDRFGNWVISKEYNGAMLAEALCKHQGFIYAPSQDPADYWRHGHSTETDFIYVTTQSLTYDALKKLSEEVGPKRTLLVCCKAYNAQEDSFPNLTVKKIPHSILSKCEWGRDDYSLRIANLPQAPVTEATADVASNETAKKANKPAAALPLFGSMGDD
ncbi:site-specific DNA-methyltransferase [Rhizobium cremeum]|uniref:site-specific DNA-methyltransferase n=1 Tax=Rhizobium cremeum TaxID=2813827 RepID=UPI0039DF8039